MMDVLFTNCFSVGELQRAITDFGHHAMTSEIFGHGLSDPTTNRIVVSNIASFLDGNLDTTDEHQRRKDLIITACCGGMLNSAQLSTALGVSLPRCRRLARAELRVSSRVRNCGFGRSRRAPSGWLRAAPTGDALLTRYEARYEKSGLR